MSVKEIKEYCEKTYSHKIRVKVRLKSTSSFIVGFISTIGTDKFYVVTNPSDLPEAVPYTFVAMITCA